ncbi:MAG TPA: methylmalonyl-CoA mutase family protein [Candidatus Limnocylindria bacterium]|nr:methylmalonyl-CoA mutase family protein [Candidatus Limnocylindria bacterium]
MTDRKRWQEHQDRWEAERLGPALERGAERKPRFITQSGVEIDRVYTPADLHDPANHPDRGRPRYRSGKEQPADGATWDQIDDLGLPGEPPFTRGIHPTGHRGRLWTMRMFAGFGTAEDTNDRFKKLIAAGGTGLSIAYDMPTLYGYDHDEPLAEGEFGTCGVAVSSLADMELLLADLPVGDISTSMTINSPAPMIWAMYIAAAEKMGVPRAQLTGTLQNDILKEFIAQKEYIFPPAPSLKLVTDTVEWGSREMPRWNTISISGYHIREAGSTAVQELAFTIADGIAYVEDALARGLRFDDFAPRLSFFFNSHNDFFEEIAKFRAARRIWYKLATERFGAENERSTWMRFHTQTAGVSLTAQQPLNNLTRVAIQALAGVLGGTQSLHTDAYDEAWAVPSEDAALLALRQQQILAEESGVANTVDPLAGSYFVETLTNQTEQAAWAYIARIDELGGMVRAIEAGFPQAEIADAAYEQSRELEVHERDIVGVTRYADPNEELRIPLLEISQEQEQRHLDRLARVRATRDADAHARAMTRLREEAVRGDVNLMPAILEAVEAYATIGEMCNALRAVYGEYREPLSV